MKQPRSARALAETVREACIEAALQGYENAAISGLCHEGAWEAAISAMRMVDLEIVLNTEPKQERLSSKDGKT